MSALDDAFHELEVDLCALNDRSYEAQVNLSALNGACHEHEVDLCVFIDALVGPIAVSRDIIYRSASQESASGPQSTSTKTSALSICWKE